MIKTFSLKDIAIKLSFLVVLILIAGFMISCSPGDNDIKEGEPQNLVDVGQEDDDKVQDVEEPEEPEEPEEMEEIELIDYIIENPLMVYMKDDGLYFSYLDNVNETRMIEAEDISNPKISPDGNFIAFTLGNDLHVYNMEVKDYGMVEELIVSYDFTDELSIIYSDINNRGLTKFDLITGEKVYVEDDNLYENLTYAKENLLYGKRILQWADNMGMYTTNVGIVEIDGTNLETELVVVGIKSDEDEIDYDPTIWSISKDGRYVYIMEKFLSGSMSADFGSLGVYDSVSKKHTAFEDIYEDKDWSGDDLVVLPKQNNLAINPQNGNMISVIMGGGREMISNKEIVALDIEDNKSYKIVRFMEEDFVAMTPSFSLDGKKLFYSATEALEVPNTTDYDSEFEEWFLQSHNIYEYDLESGQVVKLTEETSYDILPISMGDSILYLKAQDDIPQYFSLIKITNGQEEILIEDILFRDNFYSSIESGTSMDILLNSKGY